MTNKRFLHRQMASASEEKGSGPLRVIRKQRRGRVLILLWKGKQNSKLSLGTFALLISADMDCSEPGKGDKQEEQHTSVTAGRPPPILLT
jgi:hypothetical protein